MVVLASSSTIIVKRTSNAFLVREDSSRKFSLNYFSYCVGNVIAGNSWHEASLELWEGVHEIYFSKPCLICLTGFGSALIKGNGNGDGGRVDFWRLTAIPGRSLVEVYSRGVVYLSVTGGLDFAVQGKRRVDVGEGLRIRACDFSGILEEVPARYVPRDYVEEYSVKVSGNVFVGGSVRGTVRVEDVKPLGVVRLKPLNVKVGGGRVKGDDNAGKSLLYDCDDGLIVDFVGQEDSEVRGIVDRVSLDAVSMSRGGIVNITPSRREDLAVRERFVDKVISRIERMIVLACEALRRGAVKVRVRLKGRVYEAWIEELE